MFNCTYLYKHFHTCCYAINITSTLVLKRNVNSLKITHSLNMQYLIIVPSTVFLTTGQVRGRDWLSKVHFSVSKVNYFRTFKLLQL